MYKPSSFIHIWLEKAPMVFLAISAFMFIIGLNLFPYSSEQVRIKCTFTFNTVIEHHLLFRQNIFPLQRTC